MRVQFNNPGVEEVPEGLYLRLCLWFPSALERRPLIDVGFVTGGILPQAFWDDHGERIKLGEGA
jgi:hypothetical protein